MNVAARVVVRFFIVFWEMMMQEKFVRVDGMTCNNCVKHVNEALSEIPGVESVEVSLDKAGATIRSAEEIDIETIRTALDEAGYDLVD